MEVLFHGSVYAASRLKRDGGFRAPRGRRVHQESRCYQPSYEVPGPRHEALGTSSTYEELRTEQRASYRVRGSRLRCWVRRVYIWFPPFRRI